MSSCPDVCLLKLAVPNIIEGYDFIDIFLYNKHMLHSIFYYIQQMYDVTYVVDPQHVEGEMTVGTKQRSTLGEPEFNTLDEPIKDTIVSRFLLTRNIDTAQ